MEQVEGIRKRQSGERRKQKRYGPHPFPVRVRAVRMHVEQKLPVAVICQETGVSHASFEMGPDLQAGR